MTPTPRDAAAIALTRFGLGARPGEIDGVAADPAGWLERQIDPRGAAQPDGRFPTSSDQVTALQTYLREVRQFMPDDRPAPGGPPARADRAPTMADPAAEAAFAAQRDSRRALTEGIGQEFLARTRLATTTDAGFAERWPTPEGNGAHAAAARPCWRANPASTASPSGPWFMSPESAQ